MAEQGQSVGRAARIAALVVKPDAHAPLLQDADHLVEPGEVRVLFQVEVLYELAYVHALLTQILQVLSLSSALLLHP